MIRWLDFNDNLGSPPKWGHPSDNLGLHSSRVAGFTWAAPTPSCPGKIPPSVREVLHRHDQGARDPGGAGAREQLQPAWDSITCCWCGVASTGGGGEACLAPSLDQVVNAVFQTPGSTAGAAPAPPTRHAPQHRLHARGLGGGAMPPAARCAMRSSRSPGRPVTRRRFVGEDPGGFYGRALQGAGRFSLPQPFGQLRSWRKRAVQDLRYPAEFHGPRRRVRGGR